jgi:mono/diheme cytochrome c family protein
MIGRTTRLLTAAAAAMVLLTTAPARAQSPAAPPQPFAPDWAMLAGADVFASKGCGKCHGVRGFGGKEGPDLGRLQGGTSFFDIGAAMWNHLPRMGARMREAGVERARLTPAELSNVVAFIFTAQYFDELGDAARGEKLFAAKGCAQCHAVGGKGAAVGPPLDWVKRANSPVLVAAAMWNHGPRMAEVMKSKGVPRPVFRGNELIDLIAYLRATGTGAPGDTQQVIPGTPERGRQLFADKQCATCHAVGGAGARIGPDLGRPGHHISLTQFASRMWNHGPTMAARLKERGADIPQLTGQDMADLLAYLYVSRYFEAGGSARRGRELVQSKGCLTCHAVGGQGGKTPRVAADLATSSVTGSPAALVAAMWNHSGLMEAKAQAQHVVWPQLTGRNLSDIAAYLVSRSSARPRTSK